MVFCFFFYFALLFVRFHGAEGRKGFFKICFVIHFPALYIFTSYCSLAYLTFFLCVLKNDAEILICSPQNILNFSFISLDLYRLLLESQNSNDLSEVSLKRR